MESAVCGTILSYGLLVRLVAKVERVLGALGERVYARWNLLEAGYRGQALAVQRAGPWHGEPTLIN